jgi:hypothetical protein
VLSPGHEGGHKKASQFEQSFQKALEAVAEPEQEMSPTKKHQEAHQSPPSDYDSYPDDENVYAYFPAEARTPRHKKNFEAIFRDWARAVRTGGDPLGMAERLEEANPDNPTSGTSGLPGLPGFGFRFQIDLMFNPAARQRIIQAVKKGAFVRFHIRSPSAKKIWLMV